MCVCGGKGGGGGGEKCGVPGDNSGSQREAKDMYALNISMISTYYFMVCEVSQTLGLELFVYGLAGHAMKIACLESCRP